MRFHVMKRKSDQLYDTNNGASPILRKSSDINCSDSDSDTEVIITSQAYKKRKMSSDDAMKLWFSNELNKQMEKIATRDQLQGVMTAVDANTEAVAEQRRDLAGLRGSVRTMEMELTDSRRSFDERVRRLIRSTADPTLVSTLDPIPGTAGSSAGPPSTGKVETELA